MAVAPIKLTKEPNDIELVAHFKNARLSERLILLERLENKLAGFVITGMTKEQVLKNLLNWISEMKTVANSSTENKEAK
ncbi:hypothetical protein AB2K96_001704 [Yersinia enterocolitica]